MTEQQIQIKVGPIKLILKLKNNYWSKSLFEDLVYFMQKKVGDAYFNITLEPISEKISLQFNDKVRFERGPQGETVFQWINLYAVLDSDEKSLRGQVKPGKDDINSLLRICVGTLACSRGLLFLHSAGIVKSSTCFVFPGVSGSGKSTISEHAIRELKDAHVMNDELLLLEPKGKNVLVHSTPFWGALRIAGKPEEHELSGMFFLKQAKRNRVVPLDKATIVKRLLENIVMYRKEPKDIKNAMKTVTKISDKIKAFDLYFKKDMSFWPLVEQAVE